MVSDNSGESDFVDGLIDDLLPGGATFRKYAPGIGARALRLMVGPKLCLYGQNQAGKTSFVKFLVTRRPIDPTVHTDRTDRKISHRGFGFVLEGAGGAKVHFKMVRDRPGQADGKRHAKDFCAEKPTQGLIFVDASSPFSGDATFSISGFLKSFFDEARMQKRVISPRVKRLRIVVNKIDRVQPSRRQNLEEKIKRLAYSNSEGLIQRHRIRVDTCSLIAGDQYHELRHNLVQEILADTVFP